MANPFHLSLKLSAIANLNGGDDLTTVIDDPKGIITTSSVSDGMNRFSILPWRRINKIPDLSFDSTHKASTIHTLHPFPAKFPPQLARWAIEQFTKYGEIVLDPFSGSGTAIVEAQALGRHALATEIDPLACLLTKVKTTPIDRTLLSKAKTCIDELWESNRCNAHGYNFPETITPPEFPNRDYWFSKQVQQDLARLHNAIAHIEDRTVRDFFLVVFSSIIIAKGSSSVANALDIAHSRGHYIKRSDSPDVWSRFHNRYRRAIRGLEKLNEEADRRARVQVVRSDARRLPYQSMIADMIITSPPYVTAIDYPRAHKYSVWWIGDLMGVSNRIYETLRSDYIGTETLSSRSVDSSSCGLARLQLVEETLAHLDDVDRVRARRTRRYFVDMRLALGETLRVLKPWRYAVLVVGDSILRGVPVPTASCLIEIAESIRVDGAKLLHRDTLERTIRERSRQMPIKRGANGQGIKTEQVLIFQRCPAKTSYPLIPEGTASTIMMNEMTPEKNRGL